MKKPADQKRGWKLDPKNDQQIRFWTGITWTQQIVPVSDEHAELYAAAELGENVTLPPPPDAGSAAGAPDPDSKITSAGWTTAALIPIVGFFVGLAIVVRGKTEGVWIMVTAIVAGIVWFYVLSDLVLATG